MGNKQVILGILYTKYHIIRRGQKEQKLQSNASEECTSV